MSPQLSSCIKPAVSISNAKTKHKTNYKTNHERNNDESGHDPHPPLSKVFGFIKFKAQPLGLPFNVLQDGLVSYFLDRAIS